MKALFQRNKELEQKESGCDACKDYEQREEALREKLHELESEAHDTSELKKRLEEVQFESKRQREELSQARNQLDALSQLDTPDKLLAQVRQLTDEITRRKFLETKVQQSVKTLIEQNQQAKKFIKEVASGTVSGQEELQTHARLCLKRLEQRTQSDKED